MILLHPLVLLLLPAIAAWAYYAWPRAPRHLLLILKAASLALITLALAEPVLQFNDTKVAVAALVDTSASITPNDLAEASRIVTAIDKERATQSLTVLSFARATHPETPNTTFTNTPGPQGRATNIEAAITEAIAALPAGAVRRIALLSDGNENLGSVTRAAWQAQQLGIPIDTFPLTGRPKPGLRVDSVSAPTLVFSGERFPITLAINSPTATPANIELTAEDKSIGQQTVDLQAGQNQFHVRAAINSTGALALAGRVVSPTLGTAPFEYALTVRRPRVLLVSNDAPEAGDHLSQVLTASQFDIDRGALPADLSPYQLVIFNNWDMESINDADQARLETFEQQGGGLLWIAGEHNIYVDHKKEPEKPLARALPAKLAPPREPEGTCVVLIIDKSSSMEGKKMDLARSAAIGVVDNLRPTDYIAVLIFDNSFQWAVPLRKAEDRSQIKRLISGITPDGGTQIAPALAEAYRKILTSSSIYKHIVLLTDGISEEGDSATMSKEAADHRVTISTVGLGQDVNRAYLEKIALLAHGKSYFLIEPSGLEQILLRDVKEHTGTTAVEKPFKPEVRKPVEILEGVNMESAPALQGYVRFETHPGADEILQMDRKDPLLTRWQYGLGRSAVWASDAKNRWAADWLAWPGFDRFWSNLVRDLLPHAPVSEATAEFDPATQDLEVTYRTNRALPDGVALPELFVIGPAGFHEPAPLVKIGANVYRAKARIGATQGLFRVRPLADSQTFPEVGLYRSEAELTDYGVNETLLRQLAQSTGGRYRPTPAQVFDSGGKSLPGSLRLWPGLLAIAVLINLAELVTRKWPALFAFALLTLTLHASPASTARAKLEQIEFDRAARPSRIVFTEAELSAFAREEASRIAPGAVRGEAVHFSPQHADADATINFLKVRQAQGQRPGWVLRQLLDGERSVHVRVKLVSFNRGARVDVESVTVAGTTLSGAALDFVIRQFVIPNFPDAKIATWFRLSHHIERIDLAPSLASVSIAAR